MREQLERMVEDARKAYEASHAKYTKAREDKNKADAKLRAACDEASDAVNTLKAAEKALGALPPPKLEAVE